MRIAVDLDGVIFDTEKILEYYLNYMILITLKKII